MTLTTDNLLVQRPNNIGGVQRIYRFKDGHGLSLINSPRAYYFSYAWEAAVLREVSEDGEKGNLDYSTKLTNNVEVFQTDDEANKFIAKARKLFEGRKEQVQGR